MEVYKAILGVMAELSKEGIAKTRTNTQGATYKFRGIDDVLNALSGHMTTAKLVVIPRVLSRECVERTTKSGNAIFYTNVDVEFDLVSAVDGSKHTARVQGEAMDTSDKSTNKAMSAAYKYMAFQTFCIPTEGDNDTENHTHEVTGKQNEGKPVKEFKDKLPSKNDEARSVYRYLQEDLRKIKNVEDCRRWAHDADIKEQMLKIPADWVEELRKEWAAHGKALASKQAQSVGDVVADIVNQTGGKVVNDRFVDEFINGKE